MKYLLPARLSLLFVIGIVLTCLSSVFVIQVVNVWARMYLSVAVRVRYSLHGVYCKFPCMVNVRGIVSERLKD
jgi:hypothetical protein